RVYPRVADAARHHRRSAEESGRAAEINFEGEVAVASALESVTRKVDAGEPLLDADLQTLEQSRDIVALGMLADGVRRNLHGTTATYVRVLDLKLADIRSAPSSDSAGEIRIFETPATLDAAVAAATDARDAAGSTPFSAFCLFELTKYPEPLPVVLRALKQAGLDLLAQAPLD